MKKSTNRKSRTYAKNRQVFSRKGNLKLDEPDGVYVLKLVLLIIVSSTWLRLAQPITSEIVTVNALPVGMIIALFFNTFLESNPFNRKIWYAIIVVTGIISFFLPIGIIF